MENASSGIQIVPPFIKLVWELDRLGRSMRDFVNLISKFQDLGVGFKSLQDNIDTTTPTGKLTLHLFAALAEFERDIIFERTKAGLESEPEEEAADDQKDYPKKLWIKLVC